MGNKKWELGLIKWREKAAKFRGPKFEAMFAGKSFCEEPMKARERKQMGELALKIGAKLGKLRLGKIGEKGENVEGKELAWGEHSHF